MKARSQAVAVAVATVWCSLSIWLCVLGFSTYRASYSAPSVSLSRLRFIAQPRGAAGTELAPLSMRRFRALVEKVGDTANIAASVRTEVVVRSSDDLWRRQPAAFVGSEFFRITNAKPLAGRQLRSGTATGGAAECLVSEAFATTLAVTSRQAIDRELVTAAGRCTIVGVFGPSIQYWFPSVSVVALLDDQLNFPGTPIPENDDFRTVNALASLNGAATDGALKQAASQAQSPDDVAAFVVSTVPDYLIPKGRRVAARLGGVTGGVGLSLCLLVVLAACAIDSWLSLRILATHRLLGARPSTYLLIWLKRQSSVVGISLILSVIAVAALQLLVQQPAGPSSAWADLNPISALGSALLAVLIVTAMRAGTNLAVLRSVRNLTLDLTTRRSLRLSTISAATIHGSVCLLLIVGLTYTHTFLSFRRVDLGLDPERLTAFELRLRPGVSAGTLPTVYESLQSAIQTIPGVKAVSAAGNNPLVDSGGTLSVTVEGVGRFLNGEAHITPGAKRVLPGFVEAVGARLLQGRDLAWTDSSSARRVALVNRTMADAYWPGGAIGRRFKFGRAREAEEWAEVVGVVSNIQHEGFRGHIKPEAYVSLLREDNFSTRFVAFLVRWAGDERPVADIQKALNSAAGSFEYIGSTDLQDTANAPVVNLGLNALLIAGTGILACLGYFVVGALLIRAELQLRRREIGVRLANGATWRDISARIGRTLSLRVGIASGIATVLALLTIRFLKTIDNDMMSSSLATLATSIALPAVAAACGVLLSIVSLGKSSINDLLRNGS